MLKPILITLGVVCLLILLALILLRTVFAAHLNPDIQADLKAAATLRAAPSEAFTYLLGIDAPVEVDPMVRGRELMTHKDQDDAASQSSKHRSVALAEPFNCVWSKDASCYQQYFSASAARKQALASYPEMIGRYQQFKSYHDFHQPNQGVSSTFIPRYQALFTAQRLMYLSWIDQAEGLYPEHQQLVARQMQQAVLEDLSYWRAALASADTLIHKMIVTRMIYTDLTMLGAIHVQYGVASPKLQLLTPQERSMALVQMGEAVFLKSQLDSSPQQSQCTFSQLSDCIHWLIYDANDLLNMQNELIRPQLQLAKLEPADLYLHKDDAMPKPSGHWLRNPYASYQYGVDQEDDRVYLAYVFRVFDLNLDIALLNASATAPVGLRDPAWLASIQNPYGMAAGHASINAQGWLCLKTASDDPHPLDGCIPWTQSAASEP